MFISIETLDNIAFWLWIFMVLWVFKYQIKVFLAWLFFAVLTTIAVINEGVRKLWALLKR